MFVVYNTLVRKNLFGVLVVLGLLVFGSAVYAQSDEDSIRSNEIVTEVFVDNVVLTDKAQAGATLSGSFKLYNVGSTVLSNVRYRVELVQLIGSEVDAVPSEALHVSPMSDSFALNPGEQTVSFTYTLPPALPSGDLGLMVQIYEQDMTPIAYEFARLQVAGPTVSYLSHSSILVINDEEGYDLLEGPVVEKGDVVDIDVELYSELTNAVAFKPMLRIFSGTYEQPDAVYEQTFGEVVVTPEEFFAGQYILPVANLDPGVYTAVLRFESTNQQAVVPVIEARFIVDGLLPKIQSVRYENTNLIVTDGAFAVQVTYADVPVNLRRNPDGSFRDAGTAALFATSSAGSVTGDAIDALLPSGMSARVQIADALTGGVIDVQHIDFDTRSPQLTVTFADVSGVSELAVTVELSQYGEVIDSFTETVSVVSAEKQNFFLDVWYKYPMYVISGIILLLLIIIIVAVVVRARRGNVTQPVIRG